MSYAYILYTYMSYVYMFIYCMFIYYMFIYCMFLHRIRIITPRWFSITGGSRYILCSRPTAGVHIRAPAARFAR